MKKNGLVNFAATQQVTAKSSNWKFGWSASSVDAEIAGRRPAHQRTAGSASAAQGVAIPKASSSW